MTKLRTHRLNCELKVGDEVFMPSTQHTDSSFPHGDLSGTIFALQEDEDDGSTFRYVVGVVLDQSFDEENSRDFAKLEDRDFNNWEGYEEFVIKKGYVGRSYRWFPLHEVKPVDALEQIITTLEKEVESC